MVIEDHRDSMHMPDNDREWCAQLLRDHEERFHSQEKNSSIPVKIEGKGFRISGNWRAVVAIVAIIASVVIVYLWLRS